MAKFMLQPPYSYGKNPWYKLDRRKDGIQSHYGQFCEQENLYSYPLLDIVVTELP
jgi:hypothetical protein